MEFTTADLCDAHADKLHIAEDDFGDFGGSDSFCGEIETVKAFEDNSRVREAVNEPGNGRVLVVDGGGSMRRAMLGDNLAAAAVKNGWTGIIVNGCIRDSAEIREMELGVKALGTCPMKTEKRNMGERGVPVRFAGITFAPGHYCYADDDGIVVSAEKLSL